MNNKWAYLVSALAISVCNSSFAQELIPGTLVYEELEKVVVSSRHGVRSPTQSAEMLASWSPRQWPEWGVEKGYLTPRGYGLVKGTWKQNRKISPFIFSQCPNPNEVEIIADVDERTIKTAEAISEGLFPQCGIKVKVTSAKHSKLLAPLKAKVCKIRHPDSLAEKLTQNSRGVSKVYAHEISLLNKVTEGNFSGEMVGHASKHKVGLSGGPYYGSSFTEILALEWGQWPDQIPGWGQMPWAEILKVMPLRVGVFSILNRDMEVARYKGSALGAKIIESLEKAGGPKYTFLVGHDTNLANLGALFDLNWKQPDRMKNENVPGGYLTFEKWKVGNKEEIRVSYSALSPEQMHAPEVTLPPIETQILSKGIEFSQWVRHYRGRLDSRCIAND